MFIFFPLFLYSQPPSQLNKRKIDSLELVISHSKGIKKIDALISLTRLYGEFDNKEALTHAKEANQIAYEVGDSLRIVVSSRIIGQLFNRLTLYKEAELILLNSLPVAKRNAFKSDYKVMLSNLAIAYTFQAKYDMALEMNLQTLVLHEEDKDYSKMSFILNNTGIVYFKLKNFEKALEFYNKSLNVKRKNNDTYDLDRLLINIGLCYNQLKDFSKALKFFEEAFKVCGKSCSEQITVEGKFGLGVSYYSLGDFAMAKKYFTESYAIAKNIGDKRFQAENLISLAQIYVQAHNKDEALKVLGESEKIAIESGYNQILIDTYKEFLTLYGELKDHERTAYYQGKYIALKDSIYSEKLIDNIAQIQTNYAERENKAIIATNEEVINRQKRLNLAIAVIMLMSFLLIFVLYHSNRVKNKVNQALSDAKAFVELKNKELDQKVADKTADLEVANDSLTKANDELDNFIYKTSHDIRGPLASLKGICNVALMDIKDPVALEYLYKLDITAEHLNSTLTRLLIINQINNSFIRLERINFDAQINEVLALEEKKILPERLVIRKNVQPDVDFYSDKEFMRIILENLIDNAIKFHNDSVRIDPFVEINVVQNTDHVRISVIDNGIGVRANEESPDKIFQMFSRASARSNTGGIGLYITKTATNKLGGLLGFTKTPEGHTEFYIKFPMKPAWVEEQLEI